MVQLLFASGVSKEALNKSLLAIAASPPHTRYGELPITTEELEDLLAAMKFLIANGADPSHAGGDDKSTALHRLAVRKGVEAAIIFLLGHGAPLNAIDEENRTALFCVTEKEDDFGIIKLLAERGADVSIANNDGHTPLLNAANYGSTTVFQYLVDHGADPSAAAYNGEQPAHSAAYMCNTDILMTLGDLGIDLDTPDKSGFTRLLCAIHSSCSANVRLKTLEYLIAQGADVKATTIWNWSALHIAVTSQKPAQAELVQYLLD